VTVRLTLLSVVLLACLAALPASWPVEAAAALPAPISLWARGAVPGARGIGVGDTPAIYPFLPTAAKNTGAAVVVMPGGGFSRLNTDAEGVQVAGWLNGRGVAAFVLRYRLAPRYQKPDAIADAGRAVQYVRAHAAQFKIDEARIGVLGFGSGAELAADAAYNHPVPGDVRAPEPVARAASTPAFLGLIFGSAPYSSSATPVPPTFLVASSSQADHQEGALELWNALRAARVPVDAHFFARAGASAGLAKGDPSVGVWPESFYNWIRYRGWLTGQPRYRIQL
jgi:acetyl esterase/lipase